MRDIVFFEENGHKYHNLTKNFYYETSPSRIAGYWAGHTEGMFSPANSTINYAEVGTQIHLNFEKFIESQGKYVADEYVKWFKENIYTEYGTWGSEFMVHTEGLPLDYAGKLDIYDVGQMTIYDIKTGSRDRRYWEYQLSLYRLALAQYHDNNPEDYELKVIFIERKDGVLKTPKIVELTGVKTEELIKGLECYAEGIPYRPVIEGLKK